MVMVHRRRRRIIIIVSIIGVVLAAGGAGYWYFFGRSVSPLPKDVVAQATFPVYYPEKLPEGYALSADSVSGDSTAVYYTLANESTRQSVTVTMQATPPGFDAAKMIGSNPIPTTITPAGTLYNLSISGSSKYMLTNGKTLIFITSAETIDARVITAITSNLAKIESN